MHSAFNLSGFPDSMFTQLFFCWKGYALSGDIAPRNKHFYYYYFEEDEIIFENIRQSWIICFLCRGCDFVLIYLVP